MKLRANRPGRDTRDIRMLLSLCEVTTLDEAEGFYEEFYPGGWPRSTSSDHGFCNSLGGRPQGTHPTDADQPLKLPDFRFSGFLRLPTSCPHFEMVRVGISPDRRLFGMSRPSVALGCG